MSDYGLLNYKWITRPDRLTEVRIKRHGTREVSTWTTALNEIAARLKRLPPQTSAIIASARQTNEELYLLSKLAKKLDALTDSIPRFGESDKLLLNADRNPNSNGARL